MSTQPHYLYLLDTACTDGIAQALERFKEFLGALSENIPGIPTPRKIELLTHALAYVHSTGQALS